MLLFYFILFLHFFKIIFSLLRWFDSIVVCSCDVTHQTLLHALNFCISAVATQMKMITPTKHLKVIVAVAAANHLLDAGGALCRTAGGVETLVDPSRLDSYVAGSAEYVAAQKYHMGRFTLTGPGGNVRKYLYEHKGVWEKKFTMWHVSHLMNIDSSTWAGALGEKDGSAMRNYASATILAYYFYHVDGKGDAANIIAWLRAIESGTKLDQATEEHLVRGRPYAEIEKEVVKAMQKEGLVIEFTGDAGSGSAGVK
jgi:hypothetical protein